MGSAPFTEDHAHVRFRLRNVQAGAAISTVAASGFLLYELLTWDRPHRGLVATLYVLTVLCSAVLCRLDLEPIMRRPVARETFFLAWSAIGRLGGDEFAVLVPGAGPAEATLLGQRLQAALALRAPLSFGVATYPRHGVDRDGLHQRADLELYAVKHGRDSEAPGAGARELSWAAALARAVDVRMAGAHEHSSAVADYAARIGAGLGWGAERLARLRLAAMLHDVGKIGIAETILRKPGRLTEDEMTVVRTHAAIGADIVAQIAGLEGIAPWVRHSHEHVDGSGYPDGLRGEEIPLESRVMLVADAFDAMTSERAYRSAMPVADALAELRRCAGRQFDVRCVELLAQALSGEGAGAVDDVVGLR